MKKERAFKERVWRHYRLHGRHALPWRKTRDPYKILVSEVMLQQTQAGRVVPYWQEFVKRFPTIELLAGATQKEVLFLWQGLGYNRRALFLHRMAREVCARYGGRLPRDWEALAQLPGIGPYTAQAVCVLAFDADLACIETNVRTAVLHHFFPGKTDVSDREIRAVLAHMPVRSPRRWLLALMDWGAHLKQKGVRNNAQSRHYTRQSPFRGSRREVRGCVIRTILEGPKTDEELSRSCDISLERLLPVLENLKEEHMVRRHGVRWRIG